LTVVLKPGIKGRVERNIMKNRKNNKNSSNKSVTRYAIFYKSHGRYIGPYGGKEHTFSKTGLAKIMRSGEFKSLKNDVLKSKVEIREFVS
jgi:hypothetical protein